MEKEEYFTLFSIIFCSLFLLIFHILAVIGFIIGIFLIIPIEPFEKKTISGSLLITISTIILTGSIYKIIINSNQRKRVKKEKSLELQKTQELEMEEIVIL